MQIIMNDHIELKYYKRCIEEINRKYPFDAVLDREAIIDVCDRCINILAQDFTNEIRKYKHPQDLFQFMLLYSDLAIDKPHSETSHILMQMCRYIFILIPNLNLSYQATPIINTGACDLSEIFFTISQFFHYFCDIIAKNMNEYLQISHKTLASKQASM